MNYSQNIEFSSPDFSSKVRFSFPFKNHKPNNISFKNSVYMINSEKKPDNHRQYLIDFIRDNNNKSKKTPTPTPRDTISKKNFNLNQKIQEKNNEEIIDKNIFFNDYFIQKVRFEKNNYNKLNSNKLLDIIDFIGEDAKRPINLEIMNVKMNNFLPGRISSKSFGIINSYAANTNQGIDRNYNDDRVKIMINMNRPSNYPSKAPWPLISYFAIFDGHNGDHCAEFLRQNLLQFIYTNPNFPKNIERSIREAFIKADEEYLNHYSYINDDLNNRMNYNNNNLDYCNSSGSCGLILLLIDTKIYIANVGDSRCIVSCNNGEIQKDVTRDHKPEFPYEKKRIYNNNGNIYRNETVFHEDIHNISYKKILLGPFRVNPGKLSVSRTIGDARAKLIKFGGIPNIIIPEPDIYVFDCYKDNIDYFILGCDGIFDRLKSKEVFDCANVIINKKKELIEKNIIYNHCFNTNYDKKINMNTTCGNIVDMVLRAAMLRKSYDNVTCIIIAFKDLLFGNNIKNEKESNMKEHYDFYENNKKDMNNNDIIVTNHKSISKSNDSIYKNKDITIINLTKNKKNGFDNHKKYDDENNNKKDNNEDRDIHNYGYKEINKINNRYNNNFAYIADENESEDISELKNENGFKKEKIEEILTTHRRIPSQSQEKKIRELISLFSINNKKGLNSESTKLLYRSYNSKNNIIKSQQNSITKNRISLIHKNRNSNIEKNDNNKKVIHYSNASLQQNDDIEAIKKMNFMCKNIAEEKEKENLQKIKKISLLKKNNLELNKENNKNNNSYVKKYNSISKKVNDYKINMNSHSNIRYKNNEKEKNKIINDTAKKNNNIDNDNDKDTGKSCIYNNSNISNKSKNFIKSIYNTPTKVDNCKKRITTRKIVRKTNNILANSRNIGNDKDNYNLTLNIEKNNFFYSMNSEKKDTNKDNKEKNNELEKSSDKLFKTRKSKINSSEKTKNNEKDSSTNLNINDNDKQKNKTLRYKYNYYFTKDSQNKIKEKEKNNNLSKSGKFENKKKENMGIPMSSSVSIIYTKKKKNKF